MTRLKYALCALLLVFSATAFAGDDDDGYDRWNCREQSGLIGAGLQCVSCGIQQYYSSKGKPEMVPSEKWIMLLAANGRIHRDLNSSKKRDNIRGTVESESLKRLVISQIQAYGFCSRYIGKNTQQVTGGRNYRDLSGDDWKYLNTFMEGLALDPDDRKTQNKIAKDLFGFKDTVFGNGSAEAMEKLMDDLELDKQSASVTTKRTVFKKKLSSALGNGYDISGEKSETPNVIAAGDKDQGLRRCLEEVQQRLNTPEFADGNQAFCESMASSCSLAKNFCNKNAGSNDGYRPPRPLNKSLPSPPGPGKNSGGVN